VDNEQLLEEIIGPCKRLRIWGKAIVIGCKEMQFCRRKVEQCRCERLLGSFSNLVVASRAARFAVHQAVRAQANIKLRLTQDAEFLAAAARFTLLALSANNLDGGMGGHSSSLVPR
jgi:hypothetical protein